eukprot:9424183-Ditylum_brightwellii.AAC.1
MANKKNFADTEDAKKKRRNNDDKGRNRGPPSKKPRYEPRKQAGQGQEKDSYAVFRGVPDGASCPLHTNENHSSRSCGKNPFKKKTKNQKQSNRFNSGGGG